MNKDALLDIITKIPSKLSRITPFMDLFASI